MQYKEAYKKNTKQSLAGGKREKAAFDGAVVEDYDDEQDYNQDHDEELDDQEIQKQNAIIEGELKTGQAQRRLSKDEMEDALEQKVPDITSHIKGNGDQQYIFAVGGTERTQLLLKESGDLIDQIFSKDAFDLEESVKRVTATLSTDKDSLWQISQGRSLFIMRLFQIGLEKSRQEDCVALCERLYAEGLLTKQQIRRGLMRLCNQFEALVELDNPQAGKGLAFLLVEMKKKNMIQQKTLTVLPEHFLKEKIVPQSTQLAKDFEKDLEVLATEEIYLEAIDSQLLKFFSTEQKNIEDLKQFFATDVKINKWGIFNWHFVKRCIELVLQGDKDDRHSLTLLFDEIASTKNGFAAMDFGYAFDFLIQNVNSMSQRFPSYTTRVASIICDALKAEVVPARYLLDAEIFLMNDEDDSAEAQEALLRTVVNMYTGNTFVPFSGLGAESKDGPVVPRKRKYSHRQSL